MSAPAQPAPLVAVTGLTVRYGEDSPAVAGLDLTIHAGQCVALVGESGSGKSTAARALLGLAGRTATVTADRFDLGGTDVRGWDDRQWRTVRGSFAGLVLQDALVSLDPLRTVAQEIAEAVRGRADRPGRAAARAAVVPLLTDVGFPDPERRSRQYAHQLSGGLRQRALIASALGGAPRLVVADEPTTALDVSVQRQVLDLLARKRAEGLGVLLVSHDLAVVAEVADHVLVLRGGTVVEQGPPDRLLRHPEHEYTRRLVAAIPSPAAQSTHPVLHANPVLRAAPVPSTDPVLRADGVSVRYRRPGGRRQELLTALDAVTVEVPRGGAMGIVGESGSGKSTLLRVLLATQQPDDGSVTLDGAPWTGISERARRSRRRRIQVVPQDPLSSFDPRYTVQQILAEALPPGSRSNRRHAAVAALDAVALPAILLDRHPLALSGGQRQRVAIARALAAEPDVLLCDEAVSALDVLVQAQVLDLLTSIRAERGTSLVFVSHDLAVVRQISDEVLVLKDGAVVERGPVGEVYSRPQHPYTQALLSALPAALRAESP